MTSSAKVSDDSISNSYTGSSKSERLYYLDWLQVLAILGVFLFHAVHPFDDLAGWHIKNAEKPSWRLFLLDISTSGGCHFSS